MSGDHARDPMHAGPRGHPSHGQDSRQPSSAAVSVNPSPEYAEAIEALRAANDRMHQVAPSHRAGTSEPRRSGP
jgi:hypothetical protein